MKPVQTMRKNTPKNHKAAASKAAALPAATFHG